MNNKFYLVLFIVAVLVIGVGIAVKESYINFSPEPDLTYQKKPSGSLSNNSLSKFSKKESKSASQEKTDDSSGVLYNDKGKTVVKNSLPPRAKEFLEQINKLEQEVKRDISHNKPAPYKKSKAEIDALIVEGDALVARVNKQYGFDANSNMQEK